MKKSELLSKCEYQLKSDARFIQELLGHKHISTTQNSKYVPSQTLKEVKSPIEYLKM